MVESPRAVDLRLTVPADAHFREMASELAAKFAEYAGAEKHAAEAFRGAVDRLARQVANGHEPIQFEMERDAALVTVRATSGARHDQATCPLPD